MKILRCKTKNKQHIGTYLSLMLKCLGCLHFRSFPVFTSPVTSQGTYSRSTRSKKLRAVETGTVARAGKVPPQQETVVLVERTTWKRHHTTTTWPASPPVCLTVHRLCQPCWRHQRIRAMPSHLPVTCTMDAQDILKMTEVHTTSILMTQHIYSSAIELYWIGPKVKPQSLPLHVMTSLDLLRHVPLAVTTGYCSPRVHWPWQTTKIANLRSPRKRRKTKDMNQF